MANGGGAAQKSKQQEQQKEILNMAERMKTDPRFDLLTQTVSQGDAKLNAKAADNLGMKQAAKNVGYSGDLSDFVARAKFLHGQGYRAADFDSALEHTGQKGEDEQAKRLKNISVNVFTTPAEAEVRAPKAKQPKAGTMSTESGFMEAPKETVYHIDGKGEVVGPYSSDFPKIARDAIKRAGYDLLKFDTYLSDNHVTSLDITMRGKEIVSMTSSSLQAPQAAAATGEVALTVGGSQTMVLKSVQTPSAAKDQIVSQGGDSSAGGAYITNPNSLNSANGQDMAGGFNWTNLKRDMAPGDGAKLETLMKSLDPNKMSIEQYNAAIGQINSLFSKNYIDISINPATVTPAAASGAATQTNVTTIYTPILNVKDARFEFNMTQRETIQSAYLVTPGNRIPIVENGEVVVTKANIAALRIDAGLIDPIIGVMNSVGGKDTVFFGAMATLYDSGTGRVDFGLESVNGKIVPIGSLAVEVFNKGDQSLTASYEYKGQSGLVPGKPSELSFEFREKGRFIVRASVLASSVRDINDLDPTFTFGTNNPLSSRRGNFALEVGEHRIGATVTFPIGGESKHEEKGAEHAPAPQPVVVQNSKFWEQFIEAS
jgi:hypothetical protein